MQGQADLNSSELMSTHLTACNCSNLTSLEDAHTGGSHSVCKAQVALVHQGGYEIGCVILI